MCHGCADDPGLAKLCRGLRKESLRAVYLFAGLPDEVLGAILDGSGEVEVDAEQWLAFAGEAADRFHLVLEGEVGLLRQSDDGDEFIVALVGPGELFGEDLALTASARHTLSARALQPGRVAYFDRRRLHELLGREPRLAARLLETLQRRHSMLLDEIERVTVLSASDRLLAFLGREATSGRPAATRLPKRLLASRLSIRPETLSRILAKLKACDRLSEVDGCLYLNTTHPESACALCPRRLWGCPGPERALAGGLHEEA